MNNKYEGEGTLALYYFFVEQEISLEGFYYMTGHLSGMDEKTSEETGIEVILKTDLNRWRLEELLEELPPNSLVCILDDVPQTIDEMSYLVTCAGHEAIGFDRASELQAYLLADNAIPSLYLID